MARRNTASNNTAKQNSGVLSGNHCVNDNYWEHVSSSKIKLRKAFNKIKSSVEIPNLIELQKISYEQNFLQLGILPEKRRKIGLQSVLMSSFPIEGANGKVTFEFVKYDLEAPRYDVAECKRRSMSYTAALKMTVRLILWEIDEDTKTKEVSEIKEQQVYMADVPLMTESGTFVINGAERVVVSQMHRSPGVFFDHDRGKNHASGKFLYSASVIPYRGSWLDFEFDAKDHIYFRVDRKRKLPATVLLKALNMKPQEILDFYYGKTVYTKSKKGWYTKFIPENVSAHRLEEDLVNIDTGEVTLAAGEKITPRLAKKFSREGLSNIKVNLKYLLGKYAATDIISGAKELILKVGEEIKENTLQLVEKSDINEVSVLEINANCGPYIRNTLINDRTTSQDMALYDIFKIASPGELSSPEAAHTFFHGLFFDSAKYDLSEVGRDRKSVV